MRANPIPKGKEWCLFRDKLGSFLVAEWGDQGRINAESSNEQKKTSCDIVDEQAKKMSQFNTHGNNLPLDLIPSD